MVSQMSCCPTCGHLTLPDFDDVERTFSGFTTENLGLIEELLLNPEPAPVPVPEPEPEPEAGPEPEVQRVRLTAPRSRRTGGRSYRGGESTVPRAHGSNLGFKKRNKHKPLTPEAFDLLHSWFEDHILWPYADLPTRRKMAASAGLVLSQVSDWLTNRRTRHWSRAFGGVVPLSRAAVEEFLIDKHQTIENGRLFLLSL